MAQIEFLYNGKATIVQANHDEKFKDILKRLSSKIEIKFSSVYFLYSGKILDNMELTFDDLSNNLDKGRNKMSVQINDDEPINSINIDNVYSIVTSKDIICPECREKCLISVIDYKIRLYGCINEHDTDEIALEEYNNTQRIDISKIICSECKISNKYNSYKNNFFRCYQCKKNLCPLCKQKHDKTHDIFNYEEKNYRCSIHNCNYTLYCKSCKKNLCISCEMQHNNHELISFGKILPNKENLLYKLNNFKNIADKCIDDIKDIILKLNTTKKNIEYLYKLFENIIKNDYKYNNYELLQNLNEINQNINYYSKYLNDSNKDKNIYNRIKDLMNIYDKIVTMNNIRIIYKIDKEKDKIKIFDEEFVNKYKDRYKIIYENKEYKLKETFDIKKIKTKNNKLEIKLKGNYNINEMKNMLYKCNDLFSLPNISKWNKNNIFDKNQLINCTDNNKNLKRLSHKNNDNIELKIMLLGNNVGKTCILEKYVLNHTTLNQITTIGIDQKRKKVNIGKLQILLRIYDTPGQQRFRNLIEQQAKQIDGFIFVLDITHRHSLEEIEDFFQIMESVKNINNFGIICANKCDLEKERKITQEELEELGKKHNMEIYETSAKTGKNINEAFEDLIKLIL